MRSFLLPSAESHRSSSTLDLRFEAQLPSLFLFSVVRTSVAFRSAPIFVLFWKLFRSKFYSQNYKSESSLLDNLLKNECARHLFDSGHYEVSIPKQGIEGAAGDPQVIGGLHYCLAG